MVSGSIQNLVYYIGTAAAKVWW